MCIDSITQSLVRARAMDHGDFFIHDVWMHLIYPQLDIPALFAWRRVCRAAHCALTRQEFWRRRLSLDKTARISSMRSNELAALSRHFGMNISRLASILNVLFQRPPPAWYKITRRGFILHSSRERGRVHKVAAVLGLYARSYMTGGVHMYQRTTLDPDMYDRDSGTTHFKGMAELGVVVYWHPDQVPPYEMAPPREERVVLVDESRKWEGWSHTRSFGQAKAELTKEAQLQLIEQKGKGLNAWVGLFAAAHCTDDAPMSRAYWLRTKDEKL